MSNVTVPIPLKPLLKNEFKLLLEESGRSTGKTTTNNQVAVIKMMQSKYNNIWQARAESNDLRKTSFNSMLRAISTLNLERYFKSSLNPLQIICTYTGAICYFSGINGKTDDDLTATKGFEPQFGTLAMFIVDEANEVKNGAHLTAAKSTASKFLNADGTIIYAYNPHIKPNHWSHSYFNALLNSSDDNLKVYRIYSTWEDIRTLLNQSTIKEIEHMRDTDPVHYNFTYLAQPISVAGRVIYAFDKNRNLISLEELQDRIRANLRYQPVKMFYGVDSGLKRDCTAVSAWGLYPDGLLIKLHTMYLDVSKRFGGIPHSEQALIMLKWYKETRQTLGRLAIYLPDASNEYWCFDGAAITQDLMLEWEKLTGFISVAITDKDIERDLARLNNSYLSGLLKILDIEANKPSIMEIETFCRDENQEIPEGQADHTIDADKYATYRYYYAFL